MIGSVTPEADEWRLPLLWSLMKIKIQHLILFMYYRCIFRNKPIIIQCGTQMYCNLSRSFPRISLRRTSKPFLYTFPFPSEHILFCLLQSPLCPSMSQRHLELNQKWLLIQIMSNVSSLELILAPFSLQVAEGQIKDKFRKMHMIKCSSS